MLNIFISNYDDSYDLTKHYVFEIQFDSNQQKITLNKKHYSVY